MNVIRFGCLYIIVDDACKIHDVALVYGDGQIALGAAAARLSEQRKRR